MGRALLRWVIQNRKVTLFFVAALILFGLYSYYLVPKQENPQIAPPVAMITTVYPGASPEEVESGVTKVIEDELLSIPGYDYVQSFSRDSFSTIVLWLEQGSDVDASWEKLRLKMDDAQLLLPENAWEIDVNTDLDKTAGFIFSISGAAYSDEELEAYAEKLKNALARTPGISSLEIKGKQDKQLKIIVDSAKLNKISLSLDELVKLLAASNITIPSGSISDGLISIPVNTSGKFSSIGEVENLVIGISPTDGSFLQLKDIAAVGLEIEEGAEKTLYNTEKALLLVGYFDENRNALIIDKEIEKRLQKVENELPPDLNFNRVLYQPDDIDTAVNDLMLNLLQGILFVLLVIYLGMGLRNALVVATAIPLSMLITVALMNLWGIRLHQISIAGFIIALGMLVDNAIVISDAIQLRLVEGKERNEACVQGTLDVAIPVLTSTLTTVAAFIPLLLLSGVAGEYIRSIPQIVIISLSASYLVAFLVTPVLAFILFRPGQSGLAEKLDLWESIKKPVNAAMEKKTAVVLLALGVFIGSLLLAPQLNLVFFPKADKEIVYLNINSEQAANLDKTEELTGRVMEILREQPEVEELTTVIGDGLPRFFVTLSQPIKSQDYAQIMVRVSLGKGRRFPSNTQLVNYLQELLDTTIAGGTVQVKELEQAEPVEAPLMVRIIGPDRDVNIGLAEEIKSALNDIKGTGSVDSDEGMRDYRYQIELKRDVLAQLGFTGYEVQQEINTALSGRVSSLINLDGNEYDLLVKGDIKSIEELENLAIKSGLTGNKVILKQLAEVTLKPEFSLVKRFNRERVVNVTSNVLDGYSAVEIENVLQKKIAALDLKGAELLLDGEKAKIMKYFGNLGSAAVFAVLAIYIIMMVQFGSLLQPLIVLLTVPLSVIGSVLGLLLFRQPISFMALLGLVSLMGVVVNNAIILIDYINLERRTGLSIEVACREAVSKRLRPILLTTITTVLGLIPLVFSGTLFVSMAVALMSGLTTATLLTLIVIPVVYSLLVRE